MDKKSSYTAASAFPLKLFKNEELFSQLNKGHIPPIHVQFIPTNRCNLKCSFCSCANRDVHLEMHIDEIVEMIWTLKEWGTKAVTITGGGEPLLHPEFDRIIAEFYAAGIQIGLVSNGVALSLDKVNINTIRRLTWCRISLADERDIPKGISQVVSLAPNVDWAFSYVLSDSPNVSRLAAAIEFAEAHNFTHMRVVADLMHPETIPMDNLEAMFHSPLVIWQPRTDATPGTLECRIALLKPVIGPDGSVFPCCGVQYAREDYDLDLPPEMSMGNWRDLDTMTYYDGSKCVRCWYDNYNTILGHIFENYEHIEFV